MILTLSFFEGLNDAAKQYELYERYLVDDEKYYTAPLLRLVRCDSCRTKVNGAVTPHDPRVTLAEDWPWWCVDGRLEVKAEMQSDPRWDEWLKMLE